MYLAFRSLVSESPERLSAQNLILNYNCGHPVAIGPSDAGLLEAQPASAVFETQFGFSIPVTCCIRSLHFTPFVFVFPEGRTV